MKKNLKYLVGLLVILSFGLITNCLAAQVCSKNLPHSNCKCLEIDFYLPDGNWSVTAKVNHGDKDGDSAPLNPNQIIGNNAQPYSYGYWQSYPYGPDLQLILQKISNGSTTTVASFHVNQDLCYMEGQPVHSDILFSDPNYSISNITRNGSYSDNKPGQVTLTISSN